MILTASRICVFRALKLGDQLCVVPALKNLRRHFYESHITFVGLKETQWMKERYPSLIDEYFVFPGYPGLPETKVDSLQVFSFLSEMRNRQFDLAIQWHGSGEISNHIVSLFKPRKLAGFCSREHEYKYDQYFSEWRDDQHIILRFLTNLRALGVPCADVDLYFPLFDRDRRELEKLKLVPRFSYVCLHPGASTPTKYWPSENFALVARNLHELGFKIVVTGRAKEATLGEQIRKLSGVPLLNTASFDLPIGPLAQLISKAALLICNDTGVSHLAAAVKTPSVVVFKETDPNVWAPLDALLHRCIVDRSGDKVDKVIHTALNLLESARAI